MKGKHKQMDRRAAANWFMDLGYEDGYESGYQAGCMDGWFDAEAALGRSITTKEQPRDERGRFARTGA